MLVRLEDIDGVDRAQTDFGGDYLRLHLRSPLVAAAATELLLTLGYRAEPAETTTVAHWYGRDSIGELSRVEAGVIADRVIPEHRANHALPEKTVVALREAVVDALHRCFLATALSSAPSVTLRTTCAEATRAAAISLVGAEQADELAALMETDMSEDHKTGR